MKPVKPQQKLRKGDLVRLGSGPRSGMGIVLKTHASQEWPSATIHMFEDVRRIRVNQNLFSLEKITMNRFEVGQLVTIDSDNYLNTLPGVILDVSSSDDYTDAMYTVDVEEHGTQFFYGSNLVDAEESVDVR